MLAYAVVFVLGPGALALWLDARLGGRRPRSMVSLGLAGGSAMVLCAMVGEPLERLVTAVAHGQQAVFLFVACTCALLTYGFLAGVWLVRLGVDLLTEARR